MNSRTSPRHHKEPKQNAIQATLCGVDSNEVSGNETELRADATGLDTFGIKGLCIENG